MEKAIEGPQFDLSPGTLEKLTQGRDSLLQQRQQLTQGLKRIDTAIKRQDGAIELLQILLEGQQAGTSAAQDERSIGESGAAE